MNRPTSGTYYEFVFDIYNRRVSTWGVGAASPTQALIYSDSSLLAFRSTSGTNFEHYNWVGTKRVITDYTGAVQETVSSLPFGDGYSYTGADGDWSDYAGMDGDTESNTEHAQFRQYEQDQGRWLSPDPYDGSYDFTNPQSFDRYNYALNNPVSYIDPSGLNHCVDCGGGGSDCANDPICAANGGSNGDGGFWGDPWGGPPASPLGGNDFYGPDTPPGEILGIVSSSLYGGVFGTLAVGEYGQLEYLGPNGEVLDAGDAEELGLPSIAGLGFGSGFGPLAIRTKLAAVESRLHVSSVKSKLSSN
jgi:RHS repeat-associated protein